MLTETMDSAQANGFRRMLLASFGLHVGLVAVFATANLLAPKSFLLPGERVIQVEIVTAELAPQPEVVPAPPPPKPPPPPPKETIVIPEQPAPLPEKEPEPEPPPREEPPPQQTEPEPEPETEYDLRSALDALREELGDPEPTAEPAEAAPSGTPGGNVVADRALVRWISQVKRRVRGAWFLAPGFHTQSLRTEVEVLLSASGEVLGVEIVRGSGNPWYDQSVERALHRASPFPPPPEAGTWPFTFTPEDAH